MLSLLGTDFCRKRREYKKLCSHNSKLLLSGRGWLGEGTNDLTFCDFAQLTGMEMDGKDFGQVLPLIANAKETGKWLVLAGHEMGDFGQ